MYLYRTHKMNTEDKKEIDELVSVYKLKKD